MLAFGFLFKSPSLAQAAVNGQNRHVASFAKLPTATCVYIWMCSLLLHSGSWLCWLCRTCFCCSFMPCFFCTPCVRWRRVMSEAFRAFHLELLSQSLVKLPHSASHLKLFFSSFHLFVFGNGSDLSHICCKHCFLQLFVFAVCRWKLSTLGRFCSSSSLCFTSTEYFCNFMIILWSTDSVFHEEFCNMPSNILWPIVSLLFSACKHVHGTVNNCQDFFFSLRSGVSVRAL